MKLSIHLPPSPRFLSGETILFTVRLTNTGKAPADAPDPEDGGSSKIRYEVQGPPYQEPAGFPRGRRAITSASMPVRSKPLAPGATIDYEIELERIVSFPEPGEYTITTFMGADLKADPVKITIEHPTVRAARCLVDDGFQEAALVRVLAMLGKPGRLYQMMFREIRPAIGEIKRSGLVPADTNPLPAEADGVYAPWTRLHRSDLDDLRTGWSSPKALAIETSEEPGSTVSFAIPDGTQPVYPSFLLRDGNVLGFVRNPKAIQLVRFPQSGSAKVEWEAKAGACTATSATLSKEGDIAYVLTVGENLGPEFGDETDVLPVSLYQAGQSEPLAVELPSALPLADSEPSVWTDAEGGLHSALLVQDRAAAKKEEDAEEPPVEISFVRIRWNPPPDVNDGKPVVTRTRVASLAPDAKPIASRVCHKVAAAGAHRVDWVILLANNRLMSSTTPTQTQPVPAKLVMPLQLIPMSVATYLLAHDEAEVLKFWKV